MLLVDIFVDSPKNDRRDPGARLSVAWVVDVLFVRVEAAEARRVENEVVERIWWIGCGDSVNCAGLLGRGGVLTSSVLAAAAGSTYTPILRSGS